MTSQGVTESLVDAKDEARQAEVRTDLAKDMNRFTWRVIGFVTALVLGSTGLIIAVLLGVP
ncbi:MAG: hypothetical protein OXM57_07690 [bacterium]|nr:hypothetical protein [bacterium]MDE0352560.1 hypothetical protein [bacterium]